MSTRGKRGKGHASRRREDSAKAAFFNSIGHDDRPAGVRKSLPTKPQTITSSTTAALEGAAIHFDGTFIQESRDTHVIPRQSTTAAQFLGLFPQKMEFEDRVCRQSPAGAFDNVSFLKSDDAVQHLGSKFTDKRMLQTTDRRAVWRSDNTLLRRGNPFANTDATPNARSEFKREGVIREGGNSRKYVASVPKAEPIVSVIGIDVED